MIYMRLLGAALIPVFLSVVFYQLEKTKKFGHFSYWTRQLIIGLAFGAVAVWGTEHGVDIGTAVVNARDAAPLCAGLIFGAPAGLIAGFVGGVERWFAVYWGIGSFTRIACSVSTLLAGVYAAVLRRHMYEDRLPAPFMAFFTAVVMEVFHMIAVFLTNLNQSVKAYEVIRVCTLPMVVANSLGVFAAVLLVTLLSSNKELYFEDTQKITRKVQSYMLLSVLGVFIITMGFIFVQQTKLANNESLDLFESNISDIIEEVDEAVDANILRIAKQAASEIDADSTESGLKTKMRSYGFNEINIVDKNGIIVASTVPAYIGFDMSKGEQSSEFLCLSHGTEYYIQDFKPIAYNSEISYKYVGVALDDGAFVQFGYNALQYQSNISNSIKGVCENRHIGQTGFMIVFDMYGDIVSVLKDPSVPRRLPTILIDAVYRLKPDMDEIFPVEINGENYFCLYTVRNGYYICALQPEEEAERSRNIELYVNFFMETLIFAALFIVIYFVIKRLVVNSIHSINRSLSRITGGDMSVRVDVRNTGEFSALSDDINSTVDTLKRYIAEAAARIDKELEFARQIQASTLPNVFPPYPLRDEIDLYALMDPAREVGGDFYDYYWLDRDRIVLLIADVSGKGIPAAMFMMTAKTMIKNFAEVQMDLSDVFARTNTSLCENNDAGMFVTSFMCVINVRTGHVEFVNAGHNPPLIKHADGQFEYLKCRAGFVLAGMDGVKYRKQEFDMEPGSVLYLYTDGMPEATNSHDELFGEDRLKNSLNSCTALSMKELCEYVKADAEAFVAEAPQFDDMTMVAFRLLKLSE